ncbi:hypothetical protein GCM10009773_19640 [Williamsia serinedens]
MTTTQRRRQKSRQEREKVQAQLAYIARLRAMEPDATMSKRLDEMEEQIRTQSDQHPTAV